jgi:hypothetical protein
MDMTYRMSLICLKTLLCRVHFQKPTLIVTNLCPGNDESWLAVGWLLVSGLLLRGCCNMVVAGMAGMAGAGRHGPEVILPGVAKVAPL